METEDQESAYKRKLLMVGAVALALLLTAICTVLFLLIRRFQAYQAAGQQVAPPVIPLATAAQPAVVFLPVVANVAAPTATSMPISTVWRFISIDENHIAIFEYLADPSQKLVAKCKDPERPPPEKGELYTLDATGTLRPQSESKKIQRFTLISMQ